MCSTPKAQHSSTPRTRHTGSMMTSSTMTKFTEVANAAEERRRERQRQNKLKLQAQAAANAESSVKAVDSETTESGLANRLWKLLNADLLQLGHRLFTFYRLIAQRNTNNHHR